MKNIFRWMAGDFFDPSWSLSREEKRHLTRRAHTLYVNGRRLAIVTVAMFIVCAVAFVLGQAVINNLSSRAGLPQSITYVFSFLIMPVSLGFGVGTFYRFLYARPLRRAMREAGYTICIGCGYDLRGSVARDRCPGCGEVGDQTPGERSADEAGSHGDV